MTSPLAIDFHKSHVVYAICFVHFRLFSFLSLTRFDRFLCTNFTATNANENKRMKERKKWKKWWICLIHNSSLTRHKNYELKRIRMRIWNAFSFNEKQIHANQIHREKKMNEKITFRLELMRLECFPLCDASESARTHSNTNDNEMHGNSDDDETIEREIDEGNGFSIWINRHKSFKITQNVSASRCWSDRKKKDIQAKWSPQWSITRLID